MRKKRLRWQLSPILLAVALVPLLLGTWHAAHSLRNAYLAGTTADLVVRGRLLAAALSPALDSLSPAARQVWVGQLGARAGARITLLERDGTVLVDSTAEAETMDNHANRPEVAAALAGGIGRQIRYSRTLDQNMMYVALPLGEEPVGRVLRTAVPLTELDQSIGAIRRRLAMFSLVVALLAALLSLALARRISRPVEVLKRFADQFAQGQLDRRLPGIDSEELGALAAAMNDMAAELDARMSTVLQQRNELEAVLGSMTEGVLAVDLQERILRLNSAAAELFGTAPETAEGRTVQEVLRNVDLQRFVARSLAGEAPVDGELVLRRREEVYLQATGTRLRDRHGAPIGSLVVLTDVTRMRRLERVRRDFVANVSHELRTPVTAIKAAAETLLEGEHDATDRQHLLAIVQRQGERLQAIIEDLLSLSRIEQDSERQRVETAEQQIEELVQAAVQAASLAAAERQVTLAVDAPRLRWRVNGPLLEEALVNLLDNAIKYTPPDSVVTITAAADESELVLAVADQGVGIGAEHLPRVFERFYRVDPARSRRRGGTGLGLAIVKHIVAAHAGQVTVTSELGQGSRFEIRLPRA